MQHFDVNGVALEYHEQGSGETVVLVHGAPSDHRLWLPHCAALATSYRAVAYSQRYFGHGAWHDSWPPLGVQTHALRPPTTIAWGERTRPLFAVVSRAAARCIGGDGHVVVPGATHMLAEERPEDFVALVRRFLSARNLA